MTNTHSISVVIPTARIDRNVLHRLSTVVYALDVFEGDKELVIAADRRVGEDDFLRVFAASRHFIKLLETGGGRGSARTRFEALRQTQYKVILFTDDDCIVPNDWAVRMCQEVIDHGAVAGNLSALLAHNVYSSADEYVDQLRIRSMDEHGGTKYISFPNFGIDRGCLPKEPFFAHPWNTTEDIDLACQLHLAGVPIHFDERVVVRTEYPATLIGLLKRKAKHAKGIALLRRRLGEENRIRLGLAETPWQMFVRWVRLSFSSPFTLPQKLVMVVANMVYCGALFYYDNQFHSWNMESEGLK